MPAAAVYSCDIVRSAVSGIPPIIDRAADACVLLGLAGVTARQSSERMIGRDKEAAPRRVGAVHALLNVAAASLLAKSALLRRKGVSRIKARSLAALGYMLVSALAHLGGNLVYEQGICVEANKPRAKALPPGKCFDYELAAYTPNMICI